MKDWREILKLERKTAQPGDPFAPPRRCNLCNYYQGRYYELHPSAEPECIQHAKALAYALAHLPLTFHPEQEFFGGAETFRADELPPEITQEMYDGALRKFQEHGVRHFGVSWSHTIPDYNGLMRGDYKSRMEGYAIARQNGWMSANDIRALENLNPISEEEGGNAYLVNGNMIPITTAMKAQTPAEPTQTAEQRSRERK